MQKPQIFIARLPDREMARQQHELFAIYANEYRRRVGFYRKKPTHIHCNNGRAMTVLLTQRI